MNIYPLKVRYNDSDMTVTLKLDLNHIRELCSKYSKDILDIVTEAATSPAMLADVLDAAMHHRHNENPATLDGAELFDLLVDSGRLCGMSAWMELSNAVAVVSGILEKEQANAMLTSMKRRMTEVVESMKEGIEVKEEEDPSAQKESGKADALLPS